MPTEPTNRQQRATPAEPDRRDRDVERAAPTRPDLPQGAPHIAAPPVEAASAIAIPRAGSPDDAAELNRNKELRMLEADVKERQRDAWDQEVSARRAPSHLAPPNGRVIAHVPFFEGDDLSTFVERAKAQIRARIPIESATRFRAEALLKCAGGKEIPAGTEFAASDISRDDLNQFYLHSHIIPVA